jgi:hypothetical protein
MAVKIKKVKKTTTEKDNDEERQRYKMFPLGQEARTLLLHRQRRVIR